MILIAQVYLSHRVKLEGNYYNSHYTTKINIETFDVSTSFRGLQMPYFGCVI